MTLQRTSLHLMICGNLVSVSTIPLSIFKSSFSLLCPESMLSWSQRFSFTAKKEEEGGGRREEGGERGERREERKPMVAGNVNLTIML